MEDVEIKQMWAALNQKQEEMLQITKKNTEKTTGLSIKSMLNSMKPIKLFLIGLGILWIVFLYEILMNFQSNLSPFFIGSVIFQMIITMLAIAIYLYQVVVIQRVDVSESIVSTQEKLFSLKSSTLWIARIMWLQLPTWSVFYLHKKMFVATNAPWLVFQAICTAALTFLAIWLFININPKNKDKRWFQVLFQGKEWSPVIKSMEMLDELREFKK